MNEMLAALVGVMVVGGIVLTVAGLRGNEMELSTPIHTGVWTRVHNAWTNQSHPRRALLVLAVLGGVLGYVITGWLLLFAVVPTAVLGVPWLLTDPGNPEVQLLGALDRWVRAIASSMTTGKSVRDAIRATRSQTPERLRRPVGLLLARLDDRWPTRQAFFAMADELDSPDADAVLAALALAAERGGTGAAATLDALSDNIQDRLRAAREIETERAKPRIVVRHVTIISTGLLAAALVFGGQFFAPYRTPLGTVILGVLLSAYAGSLLMLRRMARPAARDRLLVWRVGERRG